MIDLSTMTLAAAVVPLAAYAVVFQTVLYLTLPAHLRTRVAPLVTGLIGAGLALGAALLFGFERIGLLGGNPRTALLWGGVTVVVMCAIGMAMLAHDHQRSWLAHQPLASLGNTAAFTQIFVRIPVFTVLIEEAFFRGVLHAALMALYPVEIAIWLGAGLFGLWHIGPGVDQAGERSAKGRAFHTVLTVVATTAGGAFLVWLRVETGSIWAPVAVHASINMTMALFTRLAARRTAVAA